MVIGIKLMPLIVSNWFEGTPTRLSQALGWELRRPSLRPKMDRLVVNWGSSKPLIIRHDTRILNNPDAVAVACSKLYSLRLLKDKEVPCLTFTEDQNEALNWLLDGSSVVCRDILNGKGGAGIRIIRRKDWHRAGRPAPDFGRARLFTRYFPKQREVRLHATPTKLLASAIKLKRRGVQYDFWVRSHNNGWVFADYPDPAEREVLVAQEAIKCLGLDFGAVDIGTDSDGNSVVFEVNTAPGLEGRTLETYVNYLKGLDNE
jgi:hypothetical protein